MYFINKIFKVKSHGKVFNLRKFTKLTTKHLYFSQLASGVYFY